MGARHQVLVLFPNLRRVPGFARLNLVHPTTLAHPMRSTTLPGWAHWEPGRASVGRRLAFGKDVLVQVHVRAAGLKATCRSELLRRYATSVEPTVGSGGW